MEMTDTGLIGAGAWMIAGMILLCTIGIAAALHYTTRD